MTNIILITFYFMLPVYMANLAPLLVRKINFLNTPIDFNKKLKGKRILGNHKTWRGLFFGIILAIITAYIQFRLNFNISILDYSNYLLIGFL